MIYKKIEVKDYEIQTKVFAWLLALLLTVWALICFMFVYNRVTYSKKYIDIKYFHSNLSNNSIKTIIPAGRILLGDNFIIENYLAEYVKTRETVIPGAYQTKDQYIRAFTSPEILTGYFDQVQRRRKLSPYLVRHISVIKTIKLDDTLFQVHYLALEKPNYKEDSGHKKEMIATLRYRQSDLPDYDLRLKIKNFELLNPLKLELLVYTTALRLS